MENEKMTKSESALHEEAVLKFWTENKIFEKTLEKEAPKGEFVFFEGPPTANAKPALHHLEARAFKDVIPRYKTMQGFHVPRRGGWDTHGLPVELQIEKKLGLNSKKAIEEYGIEKFNAECKQSVFEYIKDWEDFTDRIGYWVDKKNAYFTFNNSYIESLWNVLAEVNKKELLYKDYRIVPWCSRCGTPLASHELAQGYEDVKDLSIFVKFKVVGEDNTYFLAWTTTPWTLPGNVALAVGGKIDYVKVKVGNETFILAKSRLEVLKDQYEIISEIKGSDLAGLSYEPLYNFITPNDKSHKVYTADFVTTEDGTGIVHIAPMYGQDDFELGTKVGLPKEHVVGLDGKFLPNTGFFSSRFAMEKDETGKPTLAIDVIKDLQERGLFFDKKNYEHTYPHCWRCKTPLIYYARDSWFIAVESLRDELVKENEKINWEPSHIKEGRFGEWLKGIRDWAISRERYWGTPLPVWMSEDGDRIVVDSIETLRKYSKNRITKMLFIRYIAIQKSK
jgi:isoleucyl-tRNA synthetase